MNTKSTLVSAALFAAAASLFNVSGARAQLYNGERFIVEKGTSLTVEGGITLTDSGSIANSGTIQLTGDWTNNAVGPVDSNPGITEFNGDSAQSIRGNRSTTFGDLKINNPNGVRLGTDSKASGQLSFVNGKLFTDGHALTLTTMDTTVPGADSERYVVTTPSGTLHRAMDQTIDTAYGGFLFPIGGAHYAPVSISLNGVSKGSLDIAGRVKDGLDSIPVGLIDIIHRAKEAWELTSIGSAGIRSYQLTFDVTWSDNGGDIQKYVVAKWDTLGSSRPTPILYPRPPGYATNVTSLGIFVIGEPSGSGVHGSETELAFGAQVFPNPATDRLNVKFNSLSTSDYTISAIDMLGRTMLHASGKASVGHNQRSFDLGHLARGAYMLRIEQSGLAQTLRVVLANNNTTSGRD